MNKIGPFLAELYYFKDKLYQKSDYFHKISHKFVGKFPEREYNSSFVLILLLINVHFHIFSRNIAEFQT